MVRSISASRALSRRAGPNAFGLLLLFALAGARPAHASLNTTQPISVGNGETLTIADGDSVDTQITAIEVDGGGTLNITGGSVSGGLSSIESPGIEVNGGTVNVTGGSVSGSAGAILVYSGRVTISGGSLTGGVSDGGGTVSISGGSIDGLALDSGTMSIYGCGLQLSDPGTDGVGTLTGTLEYNTQPSMISTYGLTDSNLISTCAYDLNPLFAQSGSGKAYKLGSTIPIKLQLSDASGVNVSSSALVVHALGLTQIAGGSGTALILDPGNSNPDSDFRYDPTLPGYILNLSTKNLGAGTWQLSFSVNGQTDPSYALTFDLR